MTVKGTAKAVIDLDGTEYILGGEQVSSSKLGCMENISNEMHRITINIKNTLNKGVFYQWVERKMESISFKELKIISMTTSNIEDLEVING